MLLNLSEAISFQWQLSQAVWHGVAVGDQTAENVDSEIPLGISTIGALKTLIAERIISFATGVLDGLFLNQIFSFLSFGDRELNSQLFLDAFDNQD